MTLRRWVTLFWTTLLIGAVSSVIIGCILMVLDSEFMNRMTTTDFLINLMNMFGAGLMYSVLCQMGFFAYLTLNYIARSIIRRPGMWKVVQVILIVIVLFDLVYLPMSASKSGSGIGTYLWVPILLTFVSVAVTYWKVKLTNPTAWIPTLFFMIVMTTLEAIPALRIYETEAILDMMVPLAACNAWQILRLHVLLRPREEDVSPA